MLTTSDIQKIKTALQPEFNTLRSDINSLSSRLNKVEIGLKKLQKEVNLILNYLDREQIKLRDAVREIGHHLHLTLNI